MNIHPTAIVEKGAIIGPNCAIGPYAVIRSNVVMGEGNYIGPHCVLGEPGEHRNHANEIQGRVVIGSNNRFSEFSRVQSPCLGSVTTIGNDCYIMAGCHIGHDSTLEGRVTMAPNSVIGGGAYIGAMTNIGMGAVIHQRKRVAAGAMIGMGSCLTKDIEEDWRIWYGVPAKDHGFNQVGFERNQKREIADRL